MAWPCTGLAENGYAEHRRHNRFGIGRAGPMIDVYQKLFRAGVHKVHSRKVFQQLFWRGVHKVHISKVFHQLFWGGVHRVHNIRDSCCSLFLSFEVVKYFRNCLLPGYSRWNIPKVNIWSIGAAGSRRTFPHFSSIFTNRNWTYDRNCFHWLFGTWTKLRVCSYCCINNPARAKIFRISAEHVKGNSRN